MKMLRSGFFCLLSSIILLASSCKNQAQEEASPQESEGSSSSCDFKAGKASQNFTVNLTEAELREERPEESLTKLKTKIDGILKGLRKKEGLSCATERRIESHFAVADAYYADGRPQTAWLTLHNLRSMLKDLQKVRNGKEPKNPLIASEKDIRSYREAHNIHAIDKGYYTGAQPSHAGYEWLKEKGVTDVITLRTASEHEKEKIEELGMEFHPVGWPDMEAPDDEKVQRVQKIIKNAEGKVFQHCLRGIGRDMTMSSLIQIARGEEAERVLEHGKEIAPTWEEDQVEGDSGEPAQFEYIKEKASEMEG